MNATVLRVGGDEHRISSVKHIRDVELILARTDIDYEIFEDQDGDQFSVMYDAKAKSANRAATSRLPGLAEVMGGTVLGDVVIMGIADFRNLDGAQEGGDDEVYE